jgi:hypothetical protein
MSGACTGVAKPSPLGRPSPRPFGVKQSVGTCVCVARTEACWSVFSMFPCSAGQVVISAPMWSGKFEGVPLKSGRVVVRSCLQPLPLRNLKRTPFPLYETTVRSQLCECRVGFRFAGLPGFTLLCLLPACNLQCNTFQQLLYPTCSLICTPGFPSFEPSPCCS